MSKTVDSKVVEMRFDNSNFEKNVKQSMTTLDKLKQALKLDGATQGLTAVEQRANSLRFNGLADTIDKIADKFSGLEMIGTMAMIRLTNAAANAGINLVKSLSVDNILAGWEKLQQKSNSVSTLLSQGYDMSTVETQMEKLNWFSDETSYNFTDMIDNISKFTASGKGLKESTTAMQGIALWAAKSGQNAQKASFAMYQLSQALGAGQMRLIDWKSIQNANMDTVEFREQAIKAAIDLGKLKKVGENTYQSLVGDKATFHRDQFSESLSRGAWFTSDVMMEVYQRYGKGADQVKKIIDTMDEKFGKDLLAMDIISAYKAMNKLNKSGETLEEVMSDVGLKGDAAKAFQEMIGQLDKFGMSALIAGQEYRTFTDVINATKDAVSTKWMTVFETILGNVEEQKELWSTIGEQFYEWFAEPVDRLQQKLAKWAKLGGRNDLFEAFSNIGEAIHAIVKPIKEAWKEIFPPRTAESLVELTKKFKEFTAQLKISDKTAEALKSIFRAVFSVMKTGIQIVKTLVSALFKLIGVFRPLGELGMTAVGFLAKWVDKTAEAARNSKWLSNAVGTVVEALKKFADAVGKMIKKFLSYESFVNFFKGLFTLIKNIGLAIGKFLGGIIRNGDLNQLMKIINTGLMGGLIAKVTGFVNKLGKLTENAVGILQSVKDVLKAYEQEIHAKTLIKIAGAIAIMVGSLWVLSSIDGMALTKALTAMTMVITELMVAFKVLTWLSKDKKILLRNSLALINLSLSLLILGAAIKTIASLNFKQMLTGLVGLAGAMGVLTAAIYMLPDDGKTKKKTKGLITLSLSLLIMSVALKKIGSMDLLSIIKGLTTMLISLGGIAFILSKMNPEGALRKSIAMLVLANSLIILAGALKILGSMSWGEIGRGLTAMAGSLAILTVVMNLLPKSGGIFKSIGLFGAVVSMIVLAGALKILATMNWEDIKRSLVAMGGALTILVVAMKILGSSIGGALAGAGSLLLASFALIELALGLKILASINPKKMATAILGLAAALTVLGIAGALLSKVAGGLLAVAGAAALFGVAAVLLGTGLTLIAAGISALALALSAGTTAIVAGLSAIILGIVGLIPEIVKTLGLAIAEFCKVIIECAPLIAKALGTVLLEAVKMLKDFVPPIVTAILDLVIQTIRAVTDRVPELIMSIAELLSAIFKGFMEALQILDAKTLLGGIACIGMLAVIFQLLAGLAITAPLAALGVVAFGALLIELMGVLGIVAKFKNMVAGIKDAGEVLEAVGTAVGRFIGGIVGGFGLGVSDSMPQIATNLSDFMNNLQPFLDGVSKVKPDTVIRMGSLAAGILVLTAANFIAGLGNLLSLGNSLPKLGRDLSLFMTNAKPFIDSAILISPNMMQGVQALAGAIMVLTGAQVLKSISSLFTWFTGDNSFEKFGNEIASLGIGMKNFAKNLGTFSDSQVTSISAACEAISALAKAAKQIPNEGGLWAGLVGDNSIGKWSAYLPPLGKNLNDFVKNLGTFSTDQVNTVDAAGKALAGLAKAADEIPNSGGLVSLFTGDNDISKFADKFPTVASGIKGYADKIGTFGKDKVDSVNASTEAIKALAKIDDIDFGDLKDNSSDMAGVGTNMANFITKLASSSKDTTELAKTNADAFVELVTKFTNVNGDNVKKIGDGLKTIGETGINKFVESLSGDSPVTKVSQAIRDLISKLIDTMETKRSDVEAKFTSIVTSAIDKINESTMIDKMKTAGKNFAQGFADGIENNRYLAVDAGTNLGNAAYNAAKRAIDAHSPSKKAHKLGNFFGLGFVNGIHEYTSDAYGESYNMADEARKGLSNAISKVNDILNDGRTNQPTIRPVLDLTDVESEAGKINGLFKNVNVGGNLNAITVGMRSKGQNGTANDVVSAINKLGSNLGSTGDTYNINGITYDDQSSVSEAIQTLIRAANIERRS